MPLVENEFEMYFSKRMETVMRFLSVPSFVLLSFVLVGLNADALAQDSGDHAGLVGLLREFREFGRPEATDGVPDYSAAAMEKQYRELKTYQNRLAAIDPSSWPVSEPVDYHLVRAEMNRLEFEHRVMKRWSHDPGFYSQRMRVRRRGLRHKGGFVQYSDIPRERFYFKATGPAAPTI